ncbi:sorting nexin-16 isoform X1 [Lepisosteus oculatus]|uniref:sorting nexin-16 isoform X1 n=1 Tax=Lepisosteus oculatus TaxID=7918 RepID=UPI00370FABA3
MATPFVPVPVPMEGAALPGGARPRSQRSPSFGSISSSSSSSRGPGDDAGSGKKSSLSEQSCATPPQCQSPVIRTKLNGADSAMEYSSCDRVLPPEASSWEERPATPTVLGYEVMEERAKFTVYKILVKKSQEESWVVFRRYTDFSRLNDKLKEMFPGFRLSLPPKRWFKDNYDPDFLEDRQLGLQAFLQNLVAHKDIANCMAVREFLCLDDPPGPFDSLEESRAFCETLEETNYRLQKELIEKQREIESLRKILEEKQLHIDVLEKRIKDVPLGPEILRRPSGQGSECSVDGYVESSAVEADQEMGEDNGPEVQSAKLNHVACWCGPVAGSSPPVIEVAQVAESFQEH